MESPAQVSWRRTLAYVLPFGVFVALLGLQTVIAIPQWLKFAAPLVAIATVSRNALVGRLGSPFASAALGIVVCVLWVGPEILFPGYHQGWLFSNSIVGHVSTAAPKYSTAALVFRVLTSVVSVPMLEELFWRGWIMRWLIRREFEAVPLGTYDNLAFWAVAVLFASEHGPFWDVGLVTGVIYNWWMLRTKSLWDCILMHAVTNACLAWWVLHSGQWMYWL